MGVERAIYLGPYFAVRCPCDVATCCGSRPTPCIRNRESRSTMEDPTENHTDMTDRQEEFEGYRLTRLEEFKHIGVPNLALEMAERMVQRTMDPERPATMMELLKAVEALGAAKFSTAHHNRSDLFENAEDELRRLRVLIIELER
jgi:hypothetical protein